MNGNEICTEMFKVEQLQKRAPRITGAMQSLCYELQLEKPCLLKGMVKLSRVTIFCLQYVKGTNNEAGEQLWKERVMLAQEQSYKTPRLGWKLHSLRVHIRYPTSEKCPGHQVKGYFKVRWKRSNSPPLLCPLSLP